MLPKLRNMKEFAEAIGVSRPTVSKYFHDPESVRPATRAKIEAALERYDYRPSFHAVNQNRRNPRTIGIIVPQLTDPFYADLAGRIEQDCLVRGYSSIILSSHGSPETEARAIGMMRSLNIGGLILSPLGAASDLRQIEKLRREVPLLLFDSHIEGAEIASLGCDNAQGIGLMVDYLCETGTPPCYVDMPEVNTTARERRAGYEQAMAARGREPVVLTPGGMGWDFEAMGYALARNMLQAGGFPSSTVLCATDSFAMGVMAAACEAGLRVGRKGDLRVAGHDNHPASAFTCPSLTTVAQDVEGLASRAVDILLGLMDESAPGPLAERLPSQLVLRRSA